MITFDGYNLRDYVDKINEIDRPVLSTRNHTLVDIPGMAGAKIARSKTGVKSIRVKVQIFGQTKAEIRAKVDALAEILLTENPAPLVFGDESHKTYMAIVANETPFQELSTLGHAEIIFLCPDPYAKGTTKTTRLTNNGSTAVTIGGNAPTLPKFTTTFSASTSFFEVSLNNGPKVRITFNFTAGSILVIDHEKNHVTINGASNNATISLDSDFFKLLKGSATLTTSSNDAGAVTDMEHVERWL